MKRTYLYGMLLVLVLFHANQAMGCPVCFGETESGSEVGVNAAVWVMVGVTSMVLSMFSGLFLRFRKRMKMTLNGTNDVPSKN